MNFNKEITPIFHGFSSLPFGKLMGTHSAPAEPRSVFVLDRGSKRKALLARWREVRKKYDWVNCGSDLFDWELTLHWLLLSSKARKQKKGSSRKMEGTEKKYDWVTCGKDLQSTPDYSNLQGKPKKVRVICSSKKIAGSKEKKTVFTAQ